MITMNVHRGTTTLLHAPQTDTVWLEITHDGVTVSVYVDERTLYALRDDAAEIIVALDQLRRHPVSAGAYTVMEKI